MSSKINPKSTKINLGDSFAGSGVDLGCPGITFGRPGIIFEGHGLSFGAHGVSFGTHGLSFGPPGLSFGAPGLSFRTPGLSFGAPGLSFGHPATTKAINALIFIYLLNTVAVLFFRISESIDREISLARMSQYPVTKNKKTVDVKQLAGRNARSALNSPGQAACQTTDLKVNK